MQILKDAKAPQSIIDMAKDLECPVCERMKSIQPARPANPSRPTEVGEILAVDFSFHTTPEKERFMVINFIDEACKYHIAKVIRRDFCEYNELGNCEAKDLIAALDEWTRYLPTQRNPL